VNVDLYILVVDLTALELHNGSHHLFARHVARLQMWLQALYELAADTPVLIVGTHAEQASNVTDESADMSRLHESCILFPKNNGRWGEEIVTKLSDNSH